MVGSPGSHDHLPDSLILERLEVPEWKGRQAAHRDRLWPWVEAHLQRRSRGERHAVLDFLFVYYSQRPGELLSWSPGACAALARAEDADWPRLPFRRDGDWAWLDPRSDGFQKRRDAAAWILDLQQAMLGRKATYHCYGLHEWAMVYETEDIRHPHLGLRLPHGEIRAMVESGGLCCTHYDAFRFFSRTARPMNPAQLTSAERVNQEQPGCLHANMDLYKWMCKLRPWIASELVAEAFLLAVALRTLDMQASPYDVSVYGLQAVPIETEAGRREYATRQRELAARARELRVRFVEALTRCLAAADLIE